MIDNTALDQYSNCNCIRQIILLRDCEVQTKIYLLNISLPMTLDHLPLHPVFEESKRHLEKRPVVAQKPISSSPDELQKLVSKKSD